MGQRYPSNVPIVKNYDVTALLDITQPVPEALPGMSVFGFYIVQIPAGVALTISFRQQVPFVGIQGNVFNFAAFGNCAVMDGGIYFGTVGVSATPLQIMWFYAPSEVVTGQ